MTPVVLMEQKQVRDMNETGNTTTSQLPSRQLELRFLERASQDVTQMRSHLPRKPIDADPDEIAQIERIAAHISSTAESFGFPEISAIAGAIELIAHDGGVRSLQQKLELVMRLREQLSALDVHLEVEFDERLQQEAAADLPMSAHLPGFGARHK
jgi:HPt (histidine-containing phosphotransfer) domain-containing protein